jgi:hypothetical protein
MSKKQKRQVSSGTVTSAPAAEKIATSRITSSSNEFTPDYSPVIRDLKRIGILAGSFIALLVILSFFLR